MRPEYETVCAHRDRVLQAHNQILTVRKRIEAGHNETKTSASESLPSAQAHLDRSREAHRTARTEFNGAAAQHIEAGGDEEDVPYERVIRAFTETLAQANRNTEVRKSALVTSWNRFAHSDAKIDDINGMIRKLETTTAAGSRHFTFLDEIKEKDPIKVQDFEKLITIAYEFDEDFKAKLDQGGVMGEGERAEDYVKRFVALSPNYIRT